VLSDINYTISEPRFIYWGGGSADPPAYVFPSPCFVISRQVPVMQLTIGHLYEHKEERK